MKHETAKAIRRATHIKPKLFRAIEYALTPISQAVIHISIGLILIALPIGYFASLDEEHAQSVEMIVYFISFAGMTYLTFAIRSWVMIVWSEELKNGIFVDPSTGKVVKNRAKLKDLYILIVGLRL